MLALRVGRRTLVTTEERDSYIQLRKNYLENAHKEQKNLTANFSAIFPDMDVLIADFPSYLQDVIERTIHISLSKMAIHKIYDVDEASFEQRYSVDLSKIEKDFAHIHEAYQEIVLSSADLETYRRERADSRGQVMGGGFGLEGAAGGMLVAGAANAALGLVHGIASGAGNAISKIGDRRKKAELYSDPATRSTVSEIVFKAAFLAHRTVAEIINERSASPILGLVDPHEEEKAKALLNSVIKGRVPEAEQADVLFEALSLNPFEKDVWFEWLSRFGDSDSTLSVAAEAMGIADLSEQKGRLVAEQLSSLPTNTPEECMAGIKVVEQRGLFLGTDIQPQRHALLEKAERLETERRSFQGQLFDTKEGAEEAAATWRLSELEKSAAEFSAKGLSVRIENDQLVTNLDYLSRADKDELDRIMKMEIKRLWSKNERYVLIALLLGVIFTLPMIFLSMLLFIVSLLFWRHVNSQKREAILAAYPGIFGPLSTHDPKV